MVTGAPFWRKIVDTSCHLCRGKFKQCKLLCLIIFFSHNLRRHPGSTHRYWTTICLLLKKKLFLFCLKKAILCSFSLCVADMYLFQYNTPTPQRNISLINLIKSEIVIHLSIISLHIYVVLSLCNNISDDDFSLGKPTLANSAVFLTLFKRPLTTPPHFEHVCCKIFERLLKKCLNVCRDKIQHNNV